MAKAKKPRGEASPRAKARAALQERFKSASYNQLAAMFEAGKVSEGELRKYYTDARSKANKQIERIEKSSAPFIDDKPFFRPLASIPTISELAHEIADLNRFISGRDMPYKIKDRIKQRDKAIETLRKHHVNSVTNENFETFVRFQRWFRSSAIAASYDSDDVDVLDIFEESLDDDGQATSEEWDSLLEEFLEERG